MVKVVLGLDKLTSLEMIIGVVVQARELCHMRAQDHCGYFDVVAHSAKERSTIVKTSSASSVTNWPTSTGSSDFVKDNLEQKKEHAVPTPGPMECCTEMMQCEQEEGAWSLLCPLLLWRPFLLLAPQIVLGKVRHTLLVQYIGT